MEWAINENIVAMGDICLFQKWVSVKNFFLVKFWFLGYIYDKIMDNRKLLDESRINQRMFHLMESGFFGKKLLKEDESPYDDNDLDSMSNLILSWDKVNIDIVFTMLEAYPLVLEEFFKRSEFEELEPFLRENHLSFTKEDLYEFSDVYHVNMFNNKEITEIPKSLLNLPELGIITIAKCGLKSIPVEIGKCKIRELDLRGNDITDIPDSLTDITTLDYLDLSHNKISYLPESIGNLVGLLYLDVSNNNLHDLPDSIVKLDKLEHFDVENNYRINLPREYWAIFNQTMEDIFSDGMSYQELFHKFKNSAIMRFDSLRDGDKRKILEALYEYWNLYKK